MILLTLIVANTARASDDIRDLPYVLNEVNDALETARTKVEVPWKNPATGNSGVIIVEKTFYPSPDTPCREYRRTLNQPGGSTRVTKGTGCRVGPARWKVEEERTSSTTSTATKTAPPSPKGTSGRPSASWSPTPSKQAKPPAKTPPKAVTATKAEAKTPAATEPPPLPKFTMPSKAEI